jgi:hypothetical protein
MSREHRKEDLIILSMVAFLGDQTSMSYPFEIGEQPARGKTARRSVCSAPTAEGPPLCFPGEFT